MTLLELDRVTKRFQRGALATVALDDVSLSVDAGTFVAIWGSSRSGKTTLLRIAAGVVAPDSGSVRFDGRDIAELPRRSRNRLRRREIGCAWPSVATPPRLTVIDRVATPLLGEFSAREARTQALEALRLVTATQLASARWDELTDGDRARVAIAQALVRRPRLLLADEPTANLDMVEREEVLSVLRASATERGAAVLMTAPDVPETLRSDRTVSLADGKLIMAPRSNPGKVLPFPGTDTRPGAHEAS